MDHGEGGFLVPVQLRGLEQEAVSGIAGPCLNQRAGPAAAYEDQLRRVTLAFDVGDRSGDYRTLPGCALERHHSSGSAEVYPVGAGRHQLAACLRSEER